MHLFKSAWWDSALCLPHHSVVLYSLRKALCQSAAWSRSCRRKSVPTTQEWRGFTSTKGYECVQPPPITAQPHPNTAITQLQACSSRLCQLSSFSVPKLSFSLLTSTAPDGYLRTPSRCQPLCNELFTFVSDCRVYWNCWRCSPSGIKSLMFISTDV